MLRDPDSHVVQQAYARWAPVYDALCGPVFLNGRRAAATAARNVGGCILEIGVGTGLSFEDYDATTEIVGIDISEPMIARARERIKSGRYPFVKELAVMDAHELAYDDASFDCVVGQFVITLVEDPERVLTECARGSARRSNYPGQSSVFGTRLDCRCRTPAGAAGTQVGPPAGISLSAAGGLGADPRRSRADRAAENQAFRCLHARSFSARQ
jgi:SAM-dependent methyltransferase